MIRTLRELPKPVIVLLIGLAVNRMGSFVSIFLVLYLTGLGYSPALAGAALTGYGIGSIAGVFTGGICADRFGPRRTIVGSMLFSSIAVAAVAGVQQYGLLLVVCFLAGFITQIYRPAASTMLAELTPPDRLVMTTAVSRLGINLGAAVGPLLGVWLASYSYRLVFLVGGATALVVAVLTVLMLPPDAPARSGTAGARTAGPAVAEPRGSGYRLLLRDHRYLLVLGAMFATALAEVQYQTVLPLTVQDRGLPTGLYGTVVALNAALVIVVELPLTQVIQRLPMRVSISVGTLLIGGGLALFGVHSGVWLFYLATVAWTLGEIISSPSVNSYPALVSRPETRGRYISALTACQTTGYALGPTIGALVYQQGNDLVWVMCGLLGAAGWLGMWIGVRLPSDGRTNPQKTASANSSGSRDPE
ncbi:MFS transporter [Kitasatospora sp. NPDC093806]|uniref:MDR family MFS transporter n=1 Tax=Kitasatospora sp. NPDC093806 TaxID=3155075 RepID=UPI003431CCC6